MVLVHNNEHKNVPFAEIYLDVVLRAYYDDSRPLDCDCATAGLEASQGTSGCEHIIVIIIINFQLWCN
jgi:hypothetical protein